MSYVWESLSVKSSFLEKLSLVMKSGDNILNRFKLNVLSDSFIYLFNLV
jgi:hypothetical protein